MFNRLIKQPRPYIFLILSLPCIILGLFMLPSSLLIASNWVLFLKLLIFAGVIFLGYGLDNLPEMIDSIDFDRKTYGWRNLFFLLSLLIPFYTPTMVVNIPTIARILPILITIIFVTVSSFGFITILFKHINQSTLPLQPEYMLIKMIMITVLSIPLLYWLSKGWNLLPVLMLLGLFSYGFGLIYTRKIQLYVLFRCLTFIVVSLLIAQLSTLIVVWEIGMNRWMR
ncbi:hypothetical protein [Herpetosiphon llansteffanensis]|uniref:hypothetical protein n=1 Tax=Herpetosiphon llansteffanensis TaxID=2094568 RepID=UPI000D7CFDD1|nr:hypothetical protein [Herpetosiphon llansteffanensis]